MTSDSISDSEFIDGFVRDNYERSVEKDEYPYVVFTGRSVSFLNHKEMEHYLWWRTSVRNGKYPVGNKELVKFFFREMFVMGEHIGTIEKWARLLAKVYAGTTAGEMASSVVVGCCLTRNEFPESYGYVRDSSYFMAELLLAGPKIELTDRNISDLMEYDSKLPKGFDVFFSRFLENLASVLWDERDIGIIEYLSNKRCESRLTVFGEIHEGKARTLLGDMPHWSETCQKRFVGLVDYCLKNYPAAKGKKPSSIEGFVEESMKKAHMQVSEGTEREDRWLPGRTVCIYPDDGRIVKGIYQYDSKTFPFENRAIVHSIEYRYRFDERPRPTKKQFLDATSNRQFKECSYVPSPPSFPFFDEMDGSQTEFYLYWRSEAIKGNYLETDKGYISLLMAELIVCDDFPQYTYGQLVGLAEAYGLNDIKETCMSFALEHGIPLPEYGDSIGGFNYHWVAAIIVDALKKEPIGTIGADTLALQSAVKEQYVSADPGRISRIANVIINGFDRECVAENGKRLCDSMTGKPYRFNIPLYRSLGKFGMTKKKTVQMMDPLSDKTISDLAYVSLIVAARHVCKANGLTMPKIDSKTDPALIRKAESFLMERELTI